MKTNFTIRFGSLFKSFSSRKWISVFLTLVFLSGSKFSFAQTNDSLSVDSLQQPLSWSDLDQCLLLSIGINGPTEVKGYGKDFIPTSTDVLEKYVFNIKRSANLDVEWEVQGGAIYTTDNTNGSKVIFRGSSFNDEVRSEKWGSTIWVKWFASSKPIDRIIRLKKQASWFCDESEGWEDTGYRVSEIKVTVNPDPNYPAGFYDSQPLITNAVLSNCTTAQSYVIAGSNLNYLEQNGDYGTNVYVNEYKSVIVYLSNNWEFVRKDFQNTKGHIFIEFDEPNPFHAQYGSDWLKNIKVRPKKDNVNNIPGQLTVQIYDNLNLDLSEMHRSLLEWEYKVDLIATDCFIRIDDLCIEDGSNCQNTLTKDAYDYKNITIKGGAITGKMNTSLFKYKWYVSYDAGVAKLIAGATSASYSHPYTMAEKTVFTRVVYTTDNKFQESQTAIFYLESCAKPADNSRFICDNQIIYNCTEGKKYSFKPVRGGAFIDKDFQGDSYYIKYSWVVSYPNKSLLLNPQEEASSSANGINYKYSDLLSNYLTFTKSSKLIDEITVYRKTEKRKGLVNYYYEELFSSNTVSLKMYGFPDPDNEEISISYTPLSCKETTTELKAIIPSNLINAVTKIQWILPPSMYNATLTGTYSQLHTIKPNVITDWPYWSNVSNVPKGGTVTLIVTFADGKFSKESIEVMPPKALSVSFPTLNGTVTLCEYTPQPITPTVTNGSGNYTYSWDKWYAKCVSLNPCSTVIVKGSDMSPTVVDNLNVKVTDSQSGCSNSAKVQLFNAYAPGNGTYTWQQYNYLFALNTQQPPLANTDIVFDKIGNPYYIGKNGKLCYYKYPGNGWVNYNYAYTGIGAGPLAIYESTAGDITLYYAQTGGQLYVTTPSQSLSQTQITNGKNVSGCLKIDALGNVFYRNTSNKIISSINNYNPNGLIDVATNSNFEIVGNKIYYVNTNGYISMYNMNTNISFTLTGWNNAALAGSYVQADNLGNVYYTAVDNIIYQIPAGTNIIQATSYSMKCNGKFSVNKKTSVIYAAGNEASSTINNNIFQVYYANGWWNNPLKISINYATGIEIGQSATEAQAGTVAYFTPNVFYIGKDGGLKLITYDTRGGCVSAYQRTDKGSNEDFLPEKTSNPHSLESTQLSVAPNPLEQQSEATFNIVSDNTSVKLVLTDAMGNNTTLLINDKIYSLGQYTVSLPYEHLSTGVYFLTLYLNDIKTNTVKVLVK